jgi:hypothetical protein
MAAQAPQQQNVPIRYNVIYSSSTGTGAQVSQDEIQVFQNFFSLIYQPNNPNLVMNPQAPDVTFIVCLLTETTKLEAQNQIQTTVRIAKAAHGLQHPCIILLFGPPRPISLFDDKLKVLNTSLYNQYNKDPASVNFDDNVAVLPPIRVVKTQIKDDADTTRAVVTMRDNLDLVKEGLTFILGKQRGAAGVPVVAPAAGVPVVAPVGAQPVLSISMPTWGDVVAVVIIILLLFAAIGIIAYHYGRSRVQSTVTRRRGVSRRR